MLRLPGSMTFRRPMAAILTLSISSVVTILIVVITVLDVQREGAIYRDKLEERGLMLSRALNDMVANYVLTV